MIGWATLALAGLPTEDLRPVAAAAGVDERFAAWRVVEGLPPDTLPCDPIWPDAAWLCFRVWEQRQRRWVTTSDLVRWKGTPGDLRAAVRSGAERAVRGAELLPVGGTEARYLRIVDGDGWAAAGLLAPELLVERLGGPVRVALPAESVLIAWREGDAEVDRIVAVGVRELYDAAPDPVSPRIHHWDGARWLPFGEARATAPAAP